jgi:3-hydroxyacyl-CoA dehydrogenase
MLIACVQAIAEDMDLKLRFYGALGGEIQPRAIFASNTSSLQIGAMAAASARPELFVGLHFFNPVQVRLFLGIATTSASVRTRLYSSGLDIRQQ